MIEAYKYLNEHYEWYFKVRENKYNLPNFHTFETENPPSLKYGLDVILYLASQLWQQVPIDIRETVSLTQK